MAMREREAALSHQFKAGQNEQRSGLALRCECADSRCSATLELTPVERARARRHVSPTGYSMKTRFWVKPGHALSFERIVEEGDDYAIVEGEATPLYVIP
jgi:hypothetical protein